MLSLCFRRGQKVVVRQLETVRAVENRGACQYAERILAERLYKSGHG